MAEDADNVYNVKHVDFIISNINGETVDDIEDPLVITGISSEGFGITPTSETGIIEGFKEEAGFSVDPSTGAEASLTIKSTSPNAKDLIRLYNEQQRGKLAPFTIKVYVKDEETGGTNARKAFGFSQLIVEHTLFSTYAPFETEEQDAPDYEFTFIGYGFRAFDADADV